MRWRINKSKWYFDLFISFEIPRIRKSLCFPGHLSFLLFFQPSSNGSSGGHLAASRGVNLQMFPGTFSGVLADGVGNLRGSRWRRWVPRSSRRRQGAAGSHDWLEYGQMDTWRAKRLFGARPSSTERRLGLHLLPLFPPPHPIPGSLAEVPSQPQLDSWRLRPTSQTSESRHPKKEAPCQPN